MDGDITWRPVTVDDLPLLAGWLAQPHVARWWNHETSAAAVERDFGPTIRGEEPNEDLFVLLDGRPFGLVQRSRITDYPGEATELAAMVADTWAAHPATTCVIVAVATVNVASWRALQSAGLVRVGEGHMESDNPIDDGRHVVHRIDRPC